MFLVFCLLYICGAAVTFQCNAIQFNTTTQQTSHNSYRNLVTLVGTPNIHSLQQQQQQHMGNISSLESLPCDGRPPVTRHMT